MRTLLPNADIEYAILIVDTDLPTPPFKLTRLKTSLIEKPPIYIVVYIKVGRVRTGESADVKIYIHLHFHPPEFCN